MPRTHARIYTTLWRREDWRALSPGAQWQYFFLLTQPDIAQDGVLSLRAKRWTAAAPGISVEAIMGHLEELDRAGYVVMDETTEEILIRSFIRWDQVYTQPFVLRSAQLHLPQIESPRIRGALAAELRRIRAERDDYSTRCAKVMDEMISELAVGTTVDIPRPSGSSPVETTVDAAHPPSRENDLTREGLGNPLAEAQRDPDGERGLVTVVSSETPSPLPLSPFPSHADDSALILRSEAGAVEPAAARRGKPKNGEQPSINVQSVIGHWIDRCGEDRPPSRVVGHVSRLVREMIDVDGIPAGRVQAGLVEWQRRGLHPASLPSVVHSYGRGPGAIGDQFPAQPTRAEQKIARNLAVVQQVKAQEAAARRPALPPGGTP